MFYIQILLTHASFKFNKKSFIDVEFSVLLFVQKQLLRLNIFYLAWNTLDHHRPGADTLVRQWIAIVISREKNWNWKCLKNVESFAESQTSQPESRRVSKNPVTMHERKDLENCKRDLKNLRVL